MKIEEITSTIKSKFPNTSFTPISTEWLKQWQIDFRECPMNFNICTLRTGRAALATDDT